MKRVKVFGLILGIMLTISSPAAAVILTDGWTFDLSGIDGLPGTSGDGTYLVENVGKITYDGIAHITNYQINPDGSALGYVEGVLQVTQFIDTGGTAIVINGQNSAYQMTFDFAVDNFNEDIFATPTGNFTHLEATAVSGLFNVYVDGFANGYTLASDSTGAGFQDTDGFGVKIATFSILEGGGGPFSLLTYDGSDNATFELVSALPGVIKDSLGNDLSLLGGALLALTDSNLDAAAGQTPIGFNIGGTGNYYPTIQDVWIGNTGFTTNGYGSEVQFFVEEDGSARLRVVPEPSTIMLLGAGLLGLGLITRKRARK